MIKKIIYTTSIMVFFLVACKQQEKINKTKLEGFVFGTTYHITYLNKVNHQKSIDSLFFLINKSLSTYLPTSDISKINKGDSTVVVDDFFVEVFEKAKKIYKETDGYFDPTIGRLIDAYGFWFWKRTKKFV